MTYVITRKCVGCVDTACVDVCPVDAIDGPIPVERIRLEGAPARSDLQLYIDPDECIYCGACAPECPEQAIFDIDDVPAALSDDVERNRAFFATRRADGNRRG